MFRNGLLACSIAFTSAASAAPTATVVFSFAQWQGETPYFNLLEHGRGYITTAVFGGQHNCTYDLRKSSCGTVVRLLPPDAQSPKWRGKVIYAFQPQPDASLPTDSPVPGGHGNLFLTTQGGGSAGNGALVELSPAAGAPTGWAETIIHSFSRYQDGGYPLVRPRIDSAGNIFVATLDGGLYDGGTFVELSPPAAGQQTWTEKVLYNFGQNLDAAGPVNGFHADAQGNLYLPTNSGGQFGSGTIVELSPQNGGSTWSESVLYNFGNGAADASSPTSGLIADANGNLLGTTGQGGTANQGTIYELSPPTGGGTAWTETVLYSFTGNADGGSPGRGLLVDAAGNIFVTTKQGGVAGCTCGTLVELSPPQGGGTAWTETTLYQFPGGAGGSIPGVITVDDNGNFLIPTQNGGIHDKGALIQVTGVGYVMK